MAVHIDVNYSPFMWLLLIWWTAYLDSCFGGVFWKNIFNFPIFFKKIFSNFNSIFSSKNPCKLKKLSFLPFLPDSDVHRTFEPDVPFWTYISAKLEYFTLTIRFEWSERRMMWTSYGCFSTSNETDANPANDRRPPKENSCRTVDAGEWYRQTARKCSNSLGMCVYVHLKLMSKICRWWSVEWCFSPKIELTMKWLMVVEVKRCKIDFPSVSNRAFHHRFT